MPIYEYKCQSCGRTLEKRQKFSDAALTECPYCSGVLEKTITAPAIQFKGGGWYADLYSSSKPRPAASGEGAAASGGSGEGSGSASSTASNEGGTAKPSGSSDSTASSSSVPSTPAASTPAASK